MCVDDHSFLAEGLQARFAMERDIEFVGWLPSAERLVEEVKERRPDVLVLDIEMPGPDVFEAARDVVRSRPVTRIVFLSAYVRDHYISSAVDSGAWGYFAKGEESDSIVEGIRQVAAGQFAFSPKVLDRCQPSQTPQRVRPAPPSTRLDSLTPRECEVRRLIGRGQTRSEIAATLHRSPKTIDGHREAIMEKLDIHDRGELVRFAIREGLVEA
jgi:DNA-binding NarL/FixJ family response regulator